MTEQRRAITSEMRRAALRTTLTPPLVTRSISVMFIVGVVLNIINQGREIMAGDSIEWMRIVLTFLVPFLVSTFSAYGAALDQLRSQSE